MGCCCREMYYGAIYSSLLSAGTHQHLPVAALMLCADVLLCVCTADQMFEVGAVETCPDPSPPDHGERVPSSHTIFHEGAVVSFHCQHGYKLRGPSKAECEQQEDGTLMWEPSSIPQCLPEWTTCPLPYIEDADVYNITYRPGDRLIISCHQGFQIRYPDMDIMVAVCPEDGMWDNLPSCQGQSWADREDTILSTWKVVAFTAISVLLALLLLVFIKAFQIRLKSPCQSNGEVERSGSRSFVVVEGVPVVLPTYEEAVCRCTIEQPDTQATALVAQGEQVPQASDQNPPAYPGRVSDPLLAANPVAPSRPGHLECAGTEEWEGSSPSMSFDTAATHPMTEEMVNSPSTEETASMCPSISILDGAA